MGRSGGRIGYKVFSINTTIRNPKRNADFLKYFLPLNGKVITDTLKEQYLFSLVANGIYKFSNVSDSVKQKLISGDEPLTDKEVIDAFRNNPQKTGFAGRVTTQLRSLKDQGFLMFEDAGRHNLYRMTITKLGQHLIDNDENVTDIYSKAMIGMHAYSPARLKMLNESRPFLNTIFVIDAVNKKWEEMGHSAKGILRHEFGTFVLSMKDCDYTRTANEIISYRIKYGLQPNESYILNYLFVEKKLIDIDYDSVIKEYPDDVFRKFEMTGLIVSRGKMNYVYYDFSIYNRAKIEAIIFTFKGYKFQNFTSLRAYYDSLSNIILPWQNGESRKLVIARKAEVLGYQVPSDMDLNSAEDFLDNTYYNEMLGKVVKITDLSLIRKELLILGDCNDEKSRYEDIPESLRLEFLLALLIGKKYGMKGLVSNIIYNEEGFPLSFAPSGKPDIVFNNAACSFIFEPTMSKNRNQQLNSETSNIARHIKDEMKKTKREYRAMMVAPYIHLDVADYYRYANSANEVKMAPISIDKLIEITDSSESIDKFRENFDNVVGSLLTLKVEEYVDYINSQLLQKRKS